MPSVVLATLRLAFATSRFSDGPRQRESLAVSLAVKFDETWDQRAHSACDVNISNSGKS